MSTLDIGLYCPPALLQVRVLINEVGRAAYGAVPERVRLPLFRTLNKLITTSIFVVPIVGVMSSVKITYIAIACLMLVSLQLVVLAALSNRSSGGQALSGAQPPPEVERSYVNVYDAEGRTPLMNAAESGNLARVTELMRLGADINHQSPTSGRTALMFAAESGHVDVVRMLIQAGANGALADENNQTALFLAYTSTRINDADRLALLDLLLSSQSINPNSELVARETEEGSLLIRAVRSASNETRPVAEMRLLAERCDRNLRNSAGFTALDHALRLGDRDLVRILVECGARLYSPQGELMHDLQLYIQDHNWQDAELLPVSIGLLQRSYENAISAVGRTPPPRPQPIVLAPHIVVEHKMR